VALPHEPKIYRFHLVLMNQSTKACYYMAISNLMDIDSKVLHLQKLVSLICSVHITAHQVTLAFLLAVNKVYNCGQTPMFEVAACTEKL